MEGLPKELRVPAQLIHRAKITYHAAYFEGMVRDVMDRFGMQVVEDDGLGFPSMLSFEIGLGPLLCAIDYNDLPQLPPRAGEYDFWFKFHSTSAHVPFGNVRAFPPCSFQNWHQYRELERDVRYSASGDSILNVQRTKITLRAQQWAEDLTRRRSMVREQLRGRYGDEVDVDYTDQVTYWRKASNCLVSVHVSGMWGNMLDRAQLQMMGFGVCTLSPVLYTRLSESGPPVPGVHYVACRDDYSDLIERIEWCRENRDACCEIGAAAKRLFQQTCLPEAVWPRIGRETVQKMMGRF